MEIAITIGAVLFMAVTAGLLVAKNLIYLCGPNEVLVFSGGRYRGNDGRLRGYKIIKGGRGTRIPLLETVDRIDLTNMIIEVSVSNAYAKGGIPLSVSGVANVKIASISPSLDNAIERFLGKNRKQIIKIARETLEGNLRGVLSQLTPEEVNQDKIQFAGKLLEEAEVDLGRLGLSLDTLKIQNVSDERGFLDSIGRIQTAEVIKTARISEAKSNSLAREKDAVNKQQARLIEIQNQSEILRADSSRQIEDAQTRCGALVAEEKGTVKAQIARAKADIEVQRSRIEEVKRRLEADVLAPAEAEMKAAQAEAKGQASKVIEDGKATVAVLNQMIDTWKSGGDSARDIFLMQKLQSVMTAMVSSIDNVAVDKITILPQGGGTASKSAQLVEEIKAATGVDIPQIVNGLTKKTTST